MAKVWTHTPTKRLNGWKISIWKDAPYGISSGKCKLKQLIECCSTQVLEKLKPQTWTPNADENVEQQNPHSFLVGMQNGAGRQLLGKQSGSFLWN